MGAFLLMKAKEVEPVWDIDRTIRYTFMIKNTSSEPIFDAVFKTYAPAPLTSSQKVIKINSSDEYASRIDEYGNHVLDYHMSLIPPYGQKKISITVDLLLSQISAGGDPDNELYLSQQPKIETNNSLIINKAQDIVKDSKSVQQSLYNWLVDNVEYQKYGLKGEGALHALEHLAGNGADFSYLNVAMNRALGFPSRAVHGYIVKQNSKLSSTGFHTWSEVWMDQGWKVVDVQQKKYLEKDHEYIAMNIVHDTSKKNQSFKKYWISHPKLLVTMK